MNKKILLSTLIALLAGALIAWFIYTWHKNKQDRLISLIPDNALAVMYVPQMATLHQISLHDDWALLAGNNATTQYKNDIQNGMRWAELLQLQKTPFYLSWHVVPGSGLQWIIYLEVENNSTFDNENKEFNQLLSHLNGYQLYKRTYKNEHIYELGKSSDGEKWTFIIRQGILVGSYSGMLIEDVIRQDYQPDNHFFKQITKSHPDIQHNTKPYLAIHTKHLAELANLIGFKKNVQSWLPYFSAQAAILFGTRAEQGWKLSGPILIDLKEREQPSHMVPPVINRLPQSAAMVLHISQQGYISNTTQSLGASLAERQRLSDIFGDAYAYVAIESKRMRKYEFASAIAVRDKKKLLAATDSASALQADGYEPYHEKFMGIELKNCSATHWPFKLLMPEWSGAPELFYAFHDQKFLVSDDAEALKIFIYDMLKHDSDQSKETVKLTGSTAMLYLNIEMALPLMLDAFKAPTKTWLTKNYDVIKNWGNLVIKSDKHKTKTIQLTVGPHVTPSASKPVAKTKFVADSTIISKIYSLTHPATGEPLLVFQDLSTACYLLQPDGKLIMKKKMGALITQPPTTILWQGKPAIVLGVPHGVFIYYFNGQSAILSPFKLPDSLQHVQVYGMFDLQSDYNYTCALASKYGDLFLLDAQKNPLTGWNPMILGRALVSKPQLVQIGNQGIIIVATTDGTIHALHTDARMLPGFPVKLGRSLQQAPFYYGGHSLANSYLYVMDELGEMVKINLLGEVVSRFQLYRPDKNTRFMFTPDEGSQNFVVARQDGNKLTLFDQSYRSLFEITVPEPKVSVSYFNFGSSRRLIALHLPAQQQAYVITESGKILTGEPLPSHTHVMVTMNEARTQYELWFGKEKLLQQIIWPLH